MKYRLIEFQDSYKDDQIIKPVSENVNDYLDNMNILDFEVISHSTVEIRVGYMGERLPLDRIIIKCKVSE